MKFTKHTIIQEKGSVYVGGREEGVLNMSNRDPKIKVREPQG